MSNHYPPYSSTTYEWNQRIEYLDHRLKELEKQLESQHLNEVMQSYHKPLSLPKTTSSKFNVFEFLQKLNKPKSQSSNTSDIEKSYHVMHLSSSPISQNKSHDSFTQVKNSIQPPSSIISSISNDSCQSLSPNHAIIDSSTPQDKRFLSISSNDTKIPQVLPIFDQDRISQEFYDDPLLSLFIHDDSLPSQEKSILLSSSSTPSNEFIPSHDSIAF